MPKIGYFYRGGRGPVAEQLRVTSLVRIYKPAWNMLGDASSDSGRLTRRTGRDVRIGCMPSGKWHDSCECLGRAHQTRGPRRRAYKKWMTRSIGWYNRTEMLADERVAWLWKEANTIKSICFCYPKPPGNPVYHPSIQVAPSRSDRRPPYLYWYTCVLLWPWVYVYVIGADGGPGRASGPRLGRSVRESYAKEPIGSQRGSTMGSIFSTSRTSWTRKRGSMTAW